MGNVFMISILLEKQHHYEADKCSTHFRDPTNYATPHSPLADALKLVWDSNWHRFEFISISGVFPKQCVGLYPYIQ